MKAMEATVMVKAAEEQTIKCRRPMAKVVQKVMMTVKSQAINRCRAALQEIRGSETRRNRKRVGL